MANRQRKRRAAEHRVNGSELWRYVELAGSDNAEERLAAAENLCPCHVRRRVEEVWQALFRLLEDSDVRVRKAAYHTLEDGGDLTEAALDPIIQRGCDNESDPKLKRYITRLGAARAHAEQQRSDFARHAQMAVGSYPERGRCDFCGNNGAARKDLDTPIPVHDSARPALVCRGCDAGAVR